MPCVGDLVFLDRMSSPCRGAARWRRRMGSRGNLTVVHPIDHRRLLSANVRADVDPRVAAAPRSLLMGRSGTV